MGDVEMVGLVDRQRLARRHAGADRAGAGARFGPFGAKIKPRLLQRPGEVGVAEEFHRNAGAVAQQQHILLPRDLGVQRLEPRPGDGDQVLGLLAVAAQIALGQDIGLAGAGRVQPVLVQAAQPGFHHPRVTGRRAAHGHVLDLADVIQSCQMSLYPRQGGEALPKLSSPPILHGRRGE